MPRPVCSPSSHPSNIVPSNVYTHLFVFLARQPPDGPPWNLTIKQIPMPFFYMESIILPMGMDSPRHVWPETMDEATHCALARHCFSTDTAHPLDGLGRPLQISHSHLYSPASRPYLPLSSTFPRLAKDPATFHRYVLPLTLFIASVARMRLFQPRNVASLSCSTSPFP